MAANLQSASRRSVLAVFDFDGTLTPGDTLLPFLHHVLGTRDFALRLPLIALVIAAMALRLVSRDRAKRLVLCLSSAGMAREGLEDLRRCFAAENPVARVRARGL